MTTETQFDYVTRRLRDMRGRWTDVAQGSGVPISTVRKLGQGQIKDPRQSTVADLHSYFKRLDEFQARNAASRRMPAEVLP